jgi:hypothetical protein
MSATKIGGIHACIAGDYRYATEVTAERGDDGIVVVVRRENGAIGGMDGPGGAEPYSETARVVVGRCPNGAALVRAIKSAFDATVTRYGKPTLRWAWHATGERGLSADKAKRALASAL